MSILYYIGYYSNVLSFLIWSAIALLVFKKLRGKKVGTVETTVVDQKIVATRGGKVRYYITVTSANPTFATTLKATQSQYTNAVITKKASVEMRKAGKRMKYTLN